MAAETEQTINTILTKTINDILTSKTTEDYESAIHEFTGLGMNINAIFYRVYEIGINKRLYQRDETLINQDYQPYSSRYDYRGGIPLPKLKGTCLLYEIISVSNIFVLRKLLEISSMSVHNKLNIIMPIHMERYNLHTPHANYKTPLYVACGYFNMHRPSSIEIIHELLNHGANPNGHENIAKRMDYISPMKHILDIMFLTGCNRTKFATLQSMLETMIHFGGDLTYKHLYPVGDTVLHHIMRATKTYNYEYRNMLTWY